MAYPETVKNLHYFFRNFSALSFLFKWYPEVSRHCPKTPIILVGTKLDLRENEDILVNMRQHRMVPINFADGLATAKEMCNITTN